MVKSLETGPNVQPFWYVHVIGIFHVLVLSSHPGVKSMSRGQMEILWVQWFSVKPG